MIIDQRMGQAPLIFKRVVGPLPEISHRMSGKEIGANALGRRFPGDRLCSVLAELKRTCVLRIGPGAAGTIEAFGLVCL
ncbi:hypothetical protein D3C71_1718840 [compost metagenome]